MEFKFIAKGDRLSEFKKSEFVAGNQNTYEAVFEFDENWKPEYDVMCIVYCNDERYVPIPVVNGRCTLPPFAVGKSKIGLVGVVGEWEKDSTVISTNWVRFGVINGANNGDSATDLDASVKAIWHEYYSDMATAADNAKKAKTDAEAAAKSAYDHQEAAKNFSASASVSAASIKNMTVSANEGFEANVKKTETDYGIHLDFTLPRGEKGADGYVPIKGVDYFTEEDIKTLNIPDKSVVEANKDAVNAIKYYGDANIVPSDARLFQFSYNDFDMTAQVGKDLETDGENLSGDIVLPYEGVGPEGTYRIVSTRPSGFVNCAGITSVIIPNSITKINNFTFSACLNLKKVIIPESVTKIVRHAFFQCEKLDNVVIPDGVTSIEDHTFALCVSLKTITIPASVKSIGEEAFYFCDSLTDVYYTGTKEEWDAIVVEAENDALSRAKIHYNYIPVTKGYVDEKIGEIDNALLSIIDIQNSLIGGDGE